MTDEDAENTCEYCVRRSTCGNIYVALKIAEGAVKYCSNADLKSRFKEIYRELSDKGYQYPDARVSCHLSRDNAYAQDVLRRLEQLLRDVRTSEK